MIVVTTVVVVDCMSEAVGSRRVVNVVTLVDVELVSCTIRGVVTILVVVGMANVGRRGLWEWN